MKTKLLIVQRIFSHYRKPIFDRLSENYILHVAHTKINSNIKNVSAEYAYKVSAFKYTKKSTGIFLNILPLIKKNRYNIIIHEFAPGIISLPLLFIFRSVYKYKIVLWGHGVSKNSSKSVPGKVLSLIRYQYINISDGIILYGNINKEKLSSKIKNPEKLFVAQNTLDTQRLNEIREELDAIGKIKIKNETGFDHKFNIIFVGRLIRKKMPELLIPIFKELFDTLGSNIELHIIGSGDLEKELKDGAKENGFQDQIKFYGAIYQETELAKYIYASDIMINPGNIGLSIVHAFSCGCPVASFYEGNNGPNHSPEYEYLEHFKTGFLAKPFNIEALCSYIIQYLNDDELQNQIKNEVDRCMKDKCSIDKMLQGFDDCISYLQKKE